MGPPRLPNLIQFPLLAVPARLPVPLPEGLAIMPGRDIIVVGASAGGVEVLGTLVRGLPADLAAAVFVVLHVPPHGMSVLPQILTRAGRLPAKHAVDGEPIQPGRIYVAPPDY